MSEESKFDRVTPGGTAAAAAGAAAGAALDLVVPGVGTVAAPGLQALANFVGQGLERRRAKAVGALAEASRSSGMDEDQLLMLAAQDDSRMELALRALTAASHAQQEAKIVALGRALATGVLAEDDALVDTEAYVIDGLSRLEPPHVCVLQLLARSPIPQELGRVYKKTQLAWSVPALAEQYPQARSTLPAILGTLVAIGAVADVAVGTLDYTPAYEANEFGKLLLQRLHEAGAEGE